MVDYKRKILKIFIPIMLSNLISQVQMLIDRIFLGRLDILYMSAVGNVTPVMWATMSFVFSLQVGGSILISQAIGADDEDKAKDYAASLYKFHNIIPFILFFVWMFLSPAIFTLMGVTGKVFESCVTYARIYAPIFLIQGIGASTSVVLQTSNYTKPLIFYGLIRSGINVFLDYVLIFGNWGFPRMEIAGASLGTTISEYAGLVYCIYVLAKKKKHLTTWPGLKKIFEAKIKPYFISCRLGINTALEDFLWNFGNLVIIRILNSINQEASGIYSMVFSVEIIAVVIIGALGSSTMTVTGEAFGAKNLRLFRDELKTSMAWACIISTIFLVVVSVFPRATLSLFTNNKAVIEASVLFLILVGINLYGKSANIIVGNAIRGYGDTFWMFMTQIIGTIEVIIFACLCVYVFNLGILGVFVAVIADEIIRAIVNTIRFEKIKF